MQTICGTLIYILKGTKSLLLIQQCHTDEVLLLANISWHSLANWSILTLINVAESMRFSFWNVLMSQRMQLGRVHSKYKFSLIILLCTSCWWLMLFDEQLNRPFRDRFDDVPSIVMHESQQGFATNGKNFITGFQFSSLFCSTTYRWKCKCQAQSNQEGNIWSLNIPV